MFVSLDTAADPILIAAGIDGEYVAASTTNFCLPQMWYRLKTLRMSPSSSVCLSVSNRLLSWAYRETFVEANERCLIDEPWLIEIVA